MFKIHNFTQRKLMKKLLLTLLAMPISIVAQTTGPQPLFIQNITISPNGCLTTGTPTANISVTASGGTPSSSGQYTYTLVELDGPFAPEPQTAVTANFTDLPLDNDGDSRSFNVTVTDSSSTGSPVEYEVTLGEANSNQTISMTITSLPLGSGAGCITLLVTNPAGNTTGTGTVDFAIFPSTDDEPTPTTLTKAPFQQIFSAFPTPGSTELTAEVTVHGDCTDEDGIADYKIVFPFPQGLSNALKAYIFNKYCSCTLQSSTVKVVTPTA